MNWQHDTSIVDRESVRQYIRPGTISPQSILGPALESLLEDRVSCFGRQSDEKRHVVDGQKTQTQEFIGDEQVSQVGPGVVLAELAVAIGVQGAESPARNRLA